MAFKASGPPFSCGGLKKIETLAFKASGICYWPNLKHDYQNFFQTVHVLCIFENYHMKSLFLFSIRYLNKMAKRCKSCFNLVVPQYRMPISAKLAQTIFLSKIFQSFMLFGKIGGWKRRLGLCTYTCNQQLHILISLNLAMTQCKKNQLNKT